MKNFNYKKLLMALAQLLSRVVQSLPITPQMVLVLTRKKRALHRAVIDLIKMTLTPDIIFLYKIFHNVFVYKNG